MLNIKIGDLAAKYETSGRGVGYISTGMGGNDPGGISYGNYQLETKKGTMQAYLRSKESGKFGEELKRFPINSEGFKNRWKQLAKEEPEIFNYTQFLFLANKPGGYIDAYNWAEDHGWNVSSFAMQSAIYSTVNQSGKWKTGIFSKANIHSYDDIKTQLNKLYHARAEYFRTLNLNKKVKESIIRNRTDEDMEGRILQSWNERDDAQKLAQEVG